MLEDNGTPGWDAINHAFTALYPQQVPRHYGTALPWTLGGKDPLDGVSVYWSDQGRPHWHYVSYGLSELFGKESDDAEVSGFGFELTFRLAAPQGAIAADSPPTWPMSLLQNLARYVFQTGNTLAAGHHLDANGPIALDHPTLLRCLAFMPDPQLPPRQTRNGSLQFLQVIGLTSDEIGAILRWSTEGVLQALEPAMPLWITDLERASLLTVADIAARIDAGTRAGGAGTGMLLVEMLEWHRPDDASAMTLVLGAGQVERVLDLLAVRLAAGHAFTVASGEKQWTFAGGAEDGVQGDDLQMACTLSPQSLRKLQETLKPMRGSYPVSAALRVDVRPSCLRDSEGNALRWIGQDGAG